MKRLVSIFLFVFLAAAAYAQTSQACPSAPEDVQGCPVRSMLEGPLYSRQWIENPRCMQVVASFLGTLTGDDRKCKENYKKRLQSVQSALHDEIEIHPYNPNIKNMQSAWRQVAIAYVGEGASMVYRTYDANTEEWETRLVKITNGKMVPLDASNSSFSTTGGG